MNTAENLRFHAAGHLACAHALAASGEVNAASFVLRVVKTFTESPRVACPPAITELLVQAIDDPRAALTDLATLEGWFCDPLNTTIEKSGAFK